LIEAPEDRAPASSWTRARTSLDSLSQAMPEPLAKVLTWDPGHARAHVRLAGVCLDRFEQLQMNSQNAMELSQIAAAATTSKFPTRAELDRWLQRAVGRRRRLLATALTHTRRGLQLCPLQGQGYVYLAELCFLLGQGTPAKLAYLEQARRVRPNDPNILFASGKHAALAGDFAATIAFWKRSFHEDQLLQLQMVRMLAQRVPLPFFLQTFEPSCKDLRVLVRQYRSLPSADAAAAGQYCLDRAKAEVRGLEAQEAAAVWLTASRVCQALGQTAAAARCARLALRGDANNEAVRRQAAVALLEAGDSDGAAASLRWCLRRNPDDRVLRELYERSLRGRVDGRVAKTGAGTKRSSPGRTLH